jgi:hypothetical protein
MVLSAIANYEDIGLKSLLIATIAMGVVIRYHTPQRNGFKRERRQN